MEIDPNTKIMIAVIISSIAVLLVSQIWNEFEHEPFYGDGGRAVYPQFLLSARPDLFREIVRMERHTFDKLVSTVRAKGLLEDGRSVSVEEQLLMFLDVVCHHNAMRQTAMKFRRGLYTVHRYACLLISVCGAQLTKPLHHRYFASVLDALYALYPEYVKFGLPACHQSASICDNAKYKLFCNCLGALDVVFVPAWVPVSLQSTYRSQKGIIA